MSSDESQDLLNPPEFGGVNPERVWVELRKATTPENKLVAKSNMKKAWSALTPNVRRITIKHLNGNRTRTHRTILHFDVQSA